MSTNAWRGGWRRDGLILRPVGVTAEDRFGDVIAEQRRQDLPDLHPTSQAAPDHQEEGTAA